jgi:hypothetical protein
VLSANVHRECKRHGAQLLYSKLPLNGGGAFDETMLNALRAFDRLYGRLSADKGRAGMEGIIRNGHRAGRKAPLGYTIEHSTTGSVRCGVEVHKARLVVGRKIAPRVAEILRARA